MVGGLAPPDPSDEQVAALAVKGGIYFVLEDADLQVGKVGKEYRLLNSDEHATYLQRKGEDPALFRPDICHQSLLAILDSPLNKAGKVKKVFVRSKKNVLIDVHPQVRLPRTFRRFCGLFVQLLQKLSIRSTNSKERMLKAVKGPVTRYLPSDAIRICLSHKAQEVTDVFELACGLDEAVPVVFVVGAFAHGSVDVAYTDQTLSISQYQLSAAQVLTRITNACEQRFRIV